MAAYGTLVAQSGFSKSFTEHCVILGLINVRADLTYQQGMNRMFSRRTRWDHYWPGLAHLGEQTILNREIYCQPDTTLGVDGVTPVNDYPFGYQERFAEYRYKPSQITGKFRSTYATPLDKWHLAQKFLSLPTLGQTFIEEAVPISRIVAVNTEPNFYFDAHFDMKCARPMPTYSIPGLIDHF